jgi:hypothetical protein
VICPECGGARGRHVIVDAPVNGHLARFAQWVPCEACIGGVASCCDTSGSAQPEQSDFFGWGARKQKKAQSRSPGPCKDEGGKLG